MPQWQKFYDAYKEKGFELIAVSIDEDEKLLRSVSKERGFTFPVAWRYDDKTDDNFGDIIGTPTLYIVDRNGKVAWMKRGVSLTRSSKRSWSRCSRTDSEVRSSRHRTSVLPLPLRERAG